jgi:hypothetical protein
MIKIRTLESIKIKVEENCWSGILVRDIKKMRDRYLRDKPPVRMGNLASSLLRLSQWVKNRHKEEAIIDLMREIAWFMEWSGIWHLRTGDMQREICRWRRVWPVEQARSILAFRALQMSNRILEWSGLLERTTPELKTLDSGSSPE